MDHLGPGDDHCFQFRPPCAKQDVEVPSLFAQTLMHPAFCIMLGMII